MIRGIRHVCSCYSPPICCTKQGGTLIAHVSLPSFRQDNPLSHRIWLGALHSRLLCGQRRADFHEEELDFQQYFSTSASVRASMQDKHTDGSFRNCFSATHSGHTTDEKGRKGHRKLRPHLLFPLHLGKHLPRLKSCSSHNNSAIALLCMKACKAGSMNSCSCGLCSVHARSVMWGSPKIRAPFLEFL